jgi:hypothetical protein
MRSLNLVRVHLAAAVGALVLIGTFLVSAAVTELIGDAGEVRALRLAIVLVLPLLIGCLVTAALTGRRLAGRSRAAVVRRKQRRMQVVAVAGLVVLVPCAVILNQLAATASGGTVALEITEFGAGALNLALLGLNFRDGRALTRRRPAPAAPMVDTGA